MAKNCIIVTGFGYNSIHKSFDEWVQEDIQDWEAAIIIADNMIDSNPDEYPYNENNPPSYYQEFLISDLDEFKRQLEEARQEYGG